MANAAQVSEVPVSLPVAKVSVVSLLLVCVVAGVPAVGGSAGVLLYLARHGKLVMASAPQTAAVRASGNDDAVETTHNVVLDPMLVNLADEDGHSYLRLSVVLAEGLEKGAKSGEGRRAPGADAAVRDVILEVLGSKHAADLLAADGKDSLKKQVQAALEQKTPAAKVRAVYFTDFLVQR